LLFPQCYIYRGARRVTGVPKNTLTGSRAASGVVRVLFLGAAFLFLCKLGQFLRAARRLPAAGAFASLSKK